MSYTIKHMGLGGILDQAIAIIRDNFVLLFSITLLVLVPTTLLMGFVSISAFPQLPADATPQEIMQARQHQFSSMGWVMGIAAIASILIYPITNAAVIQAVSRLYLGQQVTAMEAMKHGLKRLLPLLGTNILRYLAIYFGLLLLVIPGIYFAIWFAVTQQVVVIESMSGTTALKRSKKLVHKDRGTCLALGIVLIVISWLVSAGANFIPQAHLRVIIATVIQALLAIFWSASFVVFYFSCRCGVENFDLHYLAEQIGAESAETAQPGLARGTP